MANNRYQNRSLTYWQLTSKSLQVKATSQVKKADIYACGGLFLVGCQVPTNLLYITVLLSIKGNKFNGGGDGGK